MKFLSIFYLLSSFAVIDSACTRKTPRREGFVRHKCVPGFYEGSCLVILEKLQFHNATESCRYDYGGRLATAPTKEAIQLWRRTIHFDSKITVNKETRFWVGYGMGSSTAANDRDDLGFKYDEPDVEMKKFVNLTMWNRVFGEPRTSAQVQWEIDADKNLLEFSTCPDYGVVFDPNNMKFDVKHNDDEHYALCETPRWAKLQCDEEWHLVPQLRMCLKVHYTLSDFIDAHEKCRQEKSFISVAQDEVELEMLRAVIVPYGFPPEKNMFIFEDSSGIHVVPLFWTGLKSMNHSTFSLDGTTSIFQTMADENLCQVFSYASFVPPGDKYPRQGISLPCKEEAPNLPYMCQRFADQSLIKNV